jgi:hypothetical protein
MEKKLYQFDLEAGISGAGQEFRNAITLAKAATMEQLVAIGKSLSITINESKSKANAAERIWLKVAGVSGKKEQKPAKEKKAPKVKSESTRVKVLPSAVITVLAKENPKRPDTAAHKSFELYATCKTVGEFTAAGGKMADIYWDRAKGFISLA